MCIRWLINCSDSTKMHGATVRFVPVTTYVTALWVSQHCRCTTLCHALFPKTNQRTNSEQQGSSREANAGLLNLVYGAGIFGKLLSARGLR